MHFTAAHALLKMHGRIAVCGTISQYNSAAPEHLPVDAMALIYKRQHMQGFIGRDWLSRGVCMQPLAQWWKEGKIQIEETLHNGIEQWPAAFQSLFTGGNSGKVVVRVA
jgi:NADPH-dependent curcumin reductase CurA